MTEPRERPVVFGAATPLLGIVTEPAPVAQPSLRSAVVLLNAGFLHRIGPNRLYVTLARRLAASGFAVLRFDYAGLGDSQPRADRKPLEAAAQDEAAAAIAFLGATTQAERFILIGLCSGADDALRAAAADPRVVGAGLIDLFFEPTPGYYLRLYAKLSFHARRWRRLLFGKSDVWRRLRAIAQNWRAQREFDRVLSAPDRRRTAATLRSVAARGAHLCLVYSADGPAHHHYERGFARVLREAAAPSRLCIAVVRNTDHVFTPLASQQQLVDVLVDWAVESERGNGTASR